MSPSDPRSTPYMQPHSELRYSVRGSEKLITVLTTTRNCIGMIADYVTSFASHDPSLFDWIVIDAASDDGTREYLQDHAKLMSYFVSEPDRGIYFGLNKAVSKVLTKYYIVFGVDDRPSESLFEDLYPLLQRDAALILGATRLMPSGNIKRPGCAAFHHWSWGRVISHHSVGTVIRTDLHDRYGLYDTNYKIVADGDFLKKVLLTGAQIIYTDKVFGEYCETGTSDQQEFIAICESFLIQLRSGSNTMLQIFLLALRLFKIKSRLTSDRSEG